MDTAALHALAKELRLTRRQRTWAEAFAADPDENQTRAAEAAGSRTKKQAAFDGCRFAKLAKVQRYVQALRTEAQQLAQQHTTASVMSIAELMQRVSLLARHDATDWITFVDHDQRELADNEKHDRELLRRVLTVTVDGKTTTETDGPRRTACCCERGRGDHWNPVSKLIDLPTPERMADDFVLDLRRACASGLGPQLSEISFDKEGRPKLKWVDKIAALTLMARLLGLDRDGVGDEPEEVRAQRLAMREALKIPEVAKAMDRVSIEIERVKFRITGERSGS